MSRSILVCVHDVTPRHFDRLRFIDEVLCGFGLRGRYSMLVVPDFWSQWPMEEHPEFVSWLRERAAEGVEMILHGYTHRDDTEYTSAVQKLKATTMTASEGEFNGLDLTEATRRLQAGRELLERLLDAEVTGFVAPAWLYSDAALRALRDLDFALAEDHLKVWVPRDGRVLLRGPVISYASRDRRRVASSLAWSRTATVLLAPTSTVRFAIHPHDYDVASLEQEIGRALGVLLRSRAPILYRELAAA